MIDRELSRGTLPMLVLKVISFGDTYGYEISKYLAELTRERIELKDGTLYPILHSLERAGSIESFWQKSETGRDRKYYRLTKSGAQHLEQRITEWHFLVETLALIVGADTAAVGGGDDE